MQYIFSSFEYNFLLDTRGARTYIHHMSNEKVAVSIRLEKETHKRYKLYAVEHDITFKEIFMEEMERRIAEAEKKKEEK